MSDDVVRVAVQSRHRLVREALALFLSDRPDFAVVGHAAGCADFSTLCALSHPDVALIDLRGWVDVPPAASAGPLAAGPVPGAVPVTAAVPVPATPVPPAGSVSAIGTVAAVGIVAGSLGAEPEPAPGPDGADRAGATTEPISVAELTDAVCRLVELLPDLAVVGIYDDSAAPMLDQMRRSGVSAVVPGSRGIDSLLATMHEHCRRRGGEDQLLDPALLTENEQRVLWLMRCGHSGPEIAGLLDVGPRTVDDLKRVINLKIAARRDGAPPRGGEAIPGPAPSRQVPDAARTTLVVIQGQTGGVADRAAQALLRHGIPYVLDRTGVDGGELPRSYQGPVVTLLVDPGPADWAARDAINTPILVVHSGPPDRAGAVQAFRHSAVAVIAADHLDEDLVPVLGLVARGYVAVDEMRARPLIEVLNTRLDGNWPMALSAREYDILRSVARGESVRQTALVLGIAPKTVENTQARLFRKLGVRNRPGALVAARRLGLLDAAESA
jgi:DNA-binding NarL/FixJ family response regulator